MRRLFRFRVWVLLAIYMSSNSNARRSSRQILSNLGAQPYNFHRMQEIESQMMETMEAALQQKMLKTFTESMNEKFSPEKEKNGERPQPSPAFGGLPTTTETKIKPFTISIGNPNFRQPTEQERTLPSNENMHGNYDNLQSKNIGSPAISPPQPVTSFTTGTPVFPGSAGIFSPGYPVSPSTFKPLHLPSDRGISEAGDAGTRALKKYFESHQKDVVPGTSVNQNFQRAVYGIPGTTPTNASPVYSYVQPATASGREGRALSPAGTFARTRFHYL